MMRRFLSSVTFVSRAFVVAVGMILFTLPALAAGTAALIIANEEYDLLDVYDDGIEGAAAVGKLLRAQGFKVVSAIDVTGKGLEETLVEFSETAQDASQIVFFFAGYTALDDGKLRLGGIGFDSADTTAASTLTEALQRIVPSDATRSNRVMTFIDSCVLGRGFDATQIAALRDSLPSSVLFANRACESGHTGTPAFSEKITQFLQSATPSRDQLGNTIVAEVNQTEGALEAPVYIGVGPDFPFYEIKVVTAPPQAVAPPPSFGRLRPRQTSPEDEAHRVGEGEGEKSTNVTLYFGTNRTREEDGLYGSTPGPLDFGVLNVSVPENHTPGVVERPSIWAFEFSEDPEKHVMIRSVTPLGREEFLSEMADDLNEAADQSAFVFIHGYNTSFDDAAFRAAQIVHDLEYGGIPSFYAWPSRAKTTSYPDDANNIITSRNSIAEFLEMVATETGAENVDILAHSMGSQYLLAALEELERRDFDEKFRNVIFAAPDVDRDAFKVQAKVALSLAEKITLYASSKDIALKASKRFNGRPRAGDSDGGVILVPGVVTIDASDFGGDDMLGHNYFTGSLPLRTDIGAILWFGLRPEARCTVETEVTEAELTAWQISHRPCNFAAYRDAHRLILSEGSAINAHAKTRALELTEDGEAAYWREVGAILSTLVK